MSAAAPALRAPRALATTPWGAWLAALCVGAFIALLLIWPIATVLHTAFADGKGGATLAHFAAFFSLSLMRESFANSLVVAFASVALATLIAVPLAYLTVRFEFRGAALAQTLGVLPLVMPPFVGAVAMQLIFGRNGSVNLFLHNAFGFRIPFMEGLNGVVFVEGLHYFPFILLNLVASMRNIDGAMEEAAQNLGAHGFSLFRRVVFPLALPGYVAGASLVFVKVFDDLGTPLVLNVTNMLAPQAYLRITSVGLEDPVGYVIAVIMIALSIAALALSARITRGRDYATLTRGGSAPARRRLAGWRAGLAYAFVVLILLLVLTPHFGILLLSVSKVWSFSMLPEGYTLAHYATVLSDSSRMIGNTLLYCGLAAGIDVVLGVAIAWLLLRTRLPGRHWLDWSASAALAIPGIVLAIGFLRAFRGVELPFGMGALTASWIAIMLAYAVRRLPYAVRSCVAALEQVHVSLEEAAQSVGANRLRTVRRIVVPLIAGGILAGFVTSFITAAVELSATILLVTRESLAPLSYGIYLYNQSIATRGPAAALGVIAVAIVAFGTWYSHRVIEQRTAMKLTVAEPVSTTLPAAGIDIEDVHLAYGTHAVLRDIALSIRPGEFFALLGPSGSGKSTLLRLIAGFAIAQRGVVRIGGRDVAALPPWKRDVGMVFQNYALWPHLTVAENVAFGLEERRWPRERIRARVRDVLALVSLADFGTRRPSQLSGGQQQRVAIARTLAIEPSVLLLDEPLSNLDAKLRASTGLELKRLQRRLGLTTVFVTHDQQEAMTIADRLAVLDQGVIQQLGTPRDLYDAPANRFVAEFVGSINLIAARIDQPDASGRRVVDLGGLGRVVLTADRVGGDIDARVQQVAVAFRPHAIRLAGASASDGLRFDADVASMQFQGEFVRYELDAGPVRLLADLPHHRFGATLAPATRQSFTVTVDELFALADNPRARAPLN